MVHYIRKNRAEAIIYVRGGNKIIQEEACKKYALDNGYEVLYTTQHIEDVKSCDILLVVDPSRISRNQLEYYKIVNELKEKSIEVVSIASHRGIEESEALARRLYAIMNDK